MKVCVIFGSSYKTGYTYNLVKDAFRGFDTHIINLVEKKINYFDYQNKHKNDDFIPCIKKAIDADIVCFATPIYWYCVSAQTKTFIDRITDLMYFEQDLFEKLKTKKVVFLATYSNDPGYALDITKNTFRYIGIKLAAHLIVKNDNFTQDMIEDFQEQCIEIDKQRSKL